MTAPDATAAVDVAALRAVAEAATPGPWVRSGSSIETDHECSPNHDCWPVADAYTATYPRDLNRADAEHIATFDPPTVLTLLALAEQHAALVEAVRGLRREWERIAHTTCPGCDSCDGARRAAIHDVLDDLAQILPAAGLGVFL